MKKSHKVIYWVSTLWLALGMTSTGIVQLLQTQDEVERMSRLGFPPYSLFILGTWKVLGVIAILVPRFPLLKEWAYAGFFFNMSGAIIAHVAMGEPLGQIFPPLLLLVLTVLSWYFRPSDRKITLATA